MNFHVLTLFPEMIEQGICTSITGRAIENGLMHLHTVNIRDYTEEKHGKVDDYPYGGGAGLLMQAQPVYDAHRACLDEIKKAGNTGKVRTIYLTPKGRTFNQKMAEELSKEQDLVFLCGHYEGIDERVLEEVVTDNVSIGDFVLTGGELPAMMMIDAISRLIPGVLHNDTSASEESFSGYLLEYSQYTRPEVWHDKKVPDALLSGDHRKIREYRQTEAIRITQKMRPDLFVNYERLMKCRDELECKNKLLYMDMIELIERGNAIFVYGDDEAVLLRDKVSGVYLLATNDLESGDDALGMLPEGEDYIVTHQEFMNDYIEENFGYRTHPACLQFVYTRKEPLPNPHADVRVLDENHLDFVCAGYEMHTRQELAERIRKKAMLGIFVKDELAGFIGEHSEGSMGMLYIAPKYRRQGLAAKLYTEMINRTLKMDRTPYCQVFEDNEASIRLQKKLGLYQAKGNIYWVGPKNA